MMNTMKNEKLMEAFEEMGIDKTMLWDEIECWLSADKLHEFLTDFARLYLDDEDLRQIKRFE